MVTVGAVPRPIGITILAILGFLEGLLLLIGGLIFIVGASFLSGIINNMGYGDITAGNFIGLAVAIVGVFVLVAALIVLLINWGLWTGKNWARWIMIIVVALGLLSALAGIVAQRYTDVFWLIVDVLVIYYLTRPAVAAFFTRAPMPQPAQPPK